MQIMILNIRPANNHASVQIMSPSQISQLSVQTSIVVDPVVQVVESKEQPIIADPVIPEVVPVSPSDSSDSAAVSSTSEVRGNIVKRTSFKSK